jgi:hypothetical protein
MPHEKATVCSGTEAKIVYQLFTVYPLIIGFLVGSADRPLKWQTVFTPTPCLGIILPNSNLLKLPINGGYYLQNEM